MSLGWAAEAAPEGGMDAVSKLIAQRMEMARDAETVRSHMANEAQAKATLAENTAYRHDTFGAQQADRDIAAGKTLGSEQSIGNDVTDIAPALKKGLQGPNMSPPTFTPMPAAPPPASLADPTQDQTAPMPAATGGGPYVPNAPSLQSPDVTKRITWLGTPQERAAKQKQDEAAQFIRQLPEGSPERLDAEYQDKLGHARPATETPAVADANYTLNGKGIVALRNKQGRLTYRGEDVSDKVTPYVAPQQGVTIIQGANGPMTYDKGSKTASPITTADGTTVDRPLPASAQQQKTNATNVLAHIGDVESEAKQIDAMGLMGPVGGRWADFMAGKIGAGELAAGDPKKAELLGEFRTDVGLLKSGMAMVHGGARGGGSPGMAARMDALINSDKMDLPLFLGATTTFKKWLTQYAGQAKAGAGTGKTVEYDANGKPIS